MALLPILISSILQTPILIAWLADSEQPQALREMLSAFFAWRFFKISWELSIVRVVVLFLVVLVIVVRFIVNVVIVVGILIVVVIILVFFLIACFSMRHALISVVCCIIGHNWISKRRTHSLHNQAKRRAFALVDRTLPSYMLANTSRKVV